MNGDEFSYTEEERNLYFLLIGEFPPEAIAIGAYEARSPFEDLSDAVQDISYLIADSVGRATRGALPEVVAESYVSFMSQLVGDGQLLYHFVETLKEIAKYQIEQYQQILQTELELLYELLVL